jgi:hypothetical protein
MYITKMANNVSYVEAVKTETPEPIQDPVNCREFDSYAACLEQLCQAGGGGEVRRPTRDFFLPAQEAFLDEFECHFLDFFLDIRDNFAMHGFLDHPKSYSTFINSVVLPSVVLVEDNAEFVDDQLSGEE